MNETLSFVDPYGRMVTVSRADWREQILHPNLQQQWNDPDRLYGIIVSALQEGHAEDVAEATERLLAIDPDPERSHAVRSVVLSRLGQLDEAQAILDAAIARKGETGTLLANLATLSAARGDLAGAEAQLWKALQADPNLEQALPWWLNLERERGGDEGLVAALEKSAALPNAWRPKLQLAGWHLEHGAPEKAGPLIDAALPAYNAQVDGSNAGLQLLRALVALGRWREGEKLLGQLYALSDPAILQPLDRFSDELFALRARDEPPRVGTPNGEVFHRGYEGPVWTYGLRNPEWLLRKKPAEGAAVAFFPLALRGEENPGPGLTRAIPLYLAEATHYWTDYKALTYLMLMQDEGPVVTGEELDGASLCGHLGPPLSHFVTGVLDTQGPEWKVGLKLWDRVKKECVVNVEGTAPAGHVGPLVLALEQRILKGLGRERFKPYDHFYARPVPEAMDGYVNAIGASSMLALVAHGLSPTSRLRGERAMLELPLTLALRFPDNEALKLMFVSGLVKATEYGSEVLPEFHLRAMQFMKDAAFRKSVAAPLEPAVLAVFGMREAVERQRAALGAGVDAKFRDWIDGILGNGEKASTAKNAESAKENK